MRNLVRSIVLLLALGLSEPVLAGPFEDAHAAYWGQDYATALRLPFFLIDHNPKTGLRIK
jgi:hypothetical protein